MAFIPFATRATRSYIGDRLINNSSAGILKRSNHIVVKINMSEILARTLTLPCGAVLSNRLVKAAMTEGLATPRGAPTPELERLYSLWSDGGASVLISGNIQVDRDHLERPGNVIIDGEPGRDMRTALAAWARAATHRGNHFWAQLSHAGRQTPKAVNARPRAPSAVKLALPGGQFGRPVEMTIPEIEDVVKRFGIAAAACKDAGFTGIQVHGAHGYLLSAFLSPRTNRREDHYGGVLRHRARALLEVVESVRCAVGPDFPVAVKLNSADFQKGGFAFEESLKVARWLEQAGVDLIEISGGTYEQPKLVGLEGIEEEEEQIVKPSTHAREAYFVDFARAMQGEVTIPLMVTGGLRSRSVMEQVIGSGSADLIGIARPMCVDTDAPAGLLTGVDELNRYERELSLLPGWASILKRVPLVRAISGFSSMYWFYAQLYALSETGLPRPDLSVFDAALQVLARERSLLRAMRPRGRPARKFLEDP
jgi:2,4-dienoyl-CoA reductase-like NADH-dependent reductase (Old Yellow Enzyme family)